MKVNDQDQMVPAHTAGLQLKEYTHLRHMHSFPETGCCYLYDKDCGHYIKLSEAQQRVIIVRTLSKIGLAKHLSHHYIVKVAANLLVFTGNLELRRSTNDISWHSRMGCWT